jgi:hypothetical protein
MLGTRIRHANLRVGIQERLPEHMLIDKPAVRLTVQGRKMRMDHEITAHIDHFELPEILTEEPIDRRFRHQDLRTGTQRPRDAECAGIRCHVKNSFRGDSIREWVMLARD